MTDFIVPPNPQIHISDADSQALPLRCFHLVALVEPDPESWMNLPDDDDHLAATLETHCDLIEDDLFPDEGVERASRTTKPVERLAEIADETRVLWVGGSYDDDFPNYYAVLAPLMAAVTFSGDYDEYQDLRYYIQGIAAHHPDWRVAVIGAMYEDDVMRVANAIQESGLGVSVLTRYCISCKGFVNLDELIALRSELRQRGMWDVEGGDLFGEE